MLYKRAAVAAITLYIASFAIGLIVSFTFDLQVAIGEALPMHFLLMQSLLSLILGFAAGWWYFRSPASAPSLKKGLLFGVVLVAMSFVLDFLLFIPGLLSGIPLAALASFYIDIWFWIAVALLIGGTTAAALFHARTVAPPQV